MPHFDKYGGDSWLCQAPKHKGNRVQSSQVVSVWRPDIAGHEGAGNVCPPCLKAYHRALPPYSETAAIVEGESYLYDKRKEQEQAYGEMMSLKEYCQAESGGLTGPALDRYISRYYGHD